MTTELQAAVHKLEGYLLAISELKADGSSFQCCCLGKIPLEEALLPLSKWLKIEENALRFFPPDNPTLSGLPSSFRHWLCTRRRVFETDDRQEIDIRLFNGFVEAMNEELGRPERWVRTGAGHAYQPGRYLGAIWDVYVLHAKDHTYAVHCSWDS